MFALLFPGQGSQFVGMGLDLYKKYDLVKEIFRKVDETLGYSLSNIILHGSDADLKLTKNTQPAIMTVGVSIFLVLMREFNMNLNRAKFFAGHSLGEYTALVCANSLSIETAAFLLHERGKAMQDSVPVGQGAMLAALGMSVDEVVKMIDLVPSNGICEVANDNCPGQVVVSGNKSSINSLCSILKKNSKKYVILPVSAPFHCSLMKKAEANMEQMIKSAKFKDPMPLVISNVSACPENEVDKIKDLLVKQITSKVRWRESIEYMVKNNVSKFIEIGPGKVLAGLVKRINRNVEIKNLCNIEEIRNFSKNV